MDAIAIGALRHRITFQRETRAPDGGGGSVVIWADVSTVWAAVEPVRGWERFEAQRLESRVSHKITIRDGLDVQAAMRVKFGERFFRIHAVRNLEERGRYRVLDCEEVML